MRIFGKDKHVKKSSHEKSMPYILICLLLSGCVGMEKPVEQVTVSKDISETITEIPSETPDTSDSKTFPDGTIAYADGTMKLAPGSCSYGLKDPFGDTLVHNGDLLTVKNHRIAGTITFRQNFPGESQEYGILLLVEFAM